MRRFRKWLAGFLDQPDARAARDSVAAYREERKARKRLRVLLDGALDEAREMEKWAGVLHKDPVLAKRVRERVDAALQAVNAVDKAVQPTATKTKKGARV